MTLVELKPNTNDISLQMITFFKSNFENQKDAHNQIFAFVFGQMLSGINRTHSGNLQHIKNKATFKSYFAHVNSETFQKLVSKLTEANKDVGHATQRHFTHYFLGCFLCFSKEEGVGMTIADLNS